MRRIPVIAVVGALLTAHPAATAPLPTKAQVQQMKRQQAALRANPTAPTRAPRATVRHTGSRPRAAQTLGGCSAHANWIPKPVPPVPS
jgi:hypothetical protein